MIPAPDGSPSLLSPADNAYIRSGGFRLRFGDWEKAWRLEKAKRARNIPVSNQIFLNGRNITGEIGELRKNRNASTLRHIGKLLGKEITKKEYLNSDSGEILRVSNRNISEILHHDLYNYGSLESICAIPDIIKNSVFISEERNQKDIHVNIGKYRYFISGLQIGNEIFTVKSVIGIDRKEKACYYDHKLINIDKKILIEAAGKKEERCFCSGFAGNKPAGLQKPSLYYDDKRLYDICQCPQAQFLEKNFEPKKEVVEAVRRGKTLRDLENDLAKNRREVSLRSPLNDFLKETRLERAPPLSGQRILPKEKQIKKDDPGLSRD